MTVTEFLRTARTIVARPGCWTQGAYTRHVDGTMAYCVVGALVAVEAWTLSMQDAADCLAAALRRRGRPSRISARDALVAYNDRPDMTQADIVALYDWAIRSKQCGQPDSGKK